MARPCTYPRKRGGIASGPAVAAGLLLVESEPGAGLNPDKKEARGDRGTGSDASAALAALDGGPELQSCSVTG